MSPQLIEPLDGVKLQQKIMNYYKKYPSKFKPTDTEYLYKSGDNYNGYYIFLRDNRIDYFVRYKAVKNISKKSMRQVLVQRFRYDYKSIGIPKKVFFDYLLHTFSGIISDTQQTQEGKKFWEGAVYDAINNKDQYNVYIIDKRKSSNNITNITNITSHDQFAEIVDDIWGSSKLFQYILIAIELK